jgi:predicted nucleic acid-binding protein
LTDVVCDTSVVLKWFHEEGEQEVEQARALLAAHRGGLLTTWILELTFYELGNILVRSLGWRATDVADQLDDLRAICPVLDPAADALRRAAELAETHALTFYDALYAATAQLHGAALATADERLLASGLGVRAGALA